MPEFYVYASDRGNEWLADDERSWTPDFHRAAAFTSADLAKDIGEREAKGRTPYVLALADGSF